MKNIVALVLLLTTSFANADELGFNFGPNWSNLSRDGSAGSAVSNSSKMSYFFGANIAYTLIPDTFDIEGGLEYWKRKYESTVSTTVLEDSLTYLALPVLGRYWITDFLVVGAGLYYALGIGNVDRTLTIGGISTSSSLTMDQANYLNSDFGFVFDLKTRFAIDENWRLLTGGRFVMGLSDVDSFTASTSKFKDIRVLLGVSYEL